jgi:hypothetical protein
MPSLPRLFDEEVGAMEPEAFDRQPPGPELRVVAEVAVYRTAGVKGMVAARYVLITMVWQTTTRSMKNQFLSTFDTDKIRECASAFGVNRQSMMRSHRRRGLPADHIR